MEKCSDTFLLCSLNTRDGGWAAMSLRCPGPPPLHACTVEGEDPSQVWLPHQPSDEDRENSTLGFFLRR